MYASCAINKYTCLWFVSLYAYNHFVSFWICWWRTEFMQSNRFGTHSIQVQLFSRGKSVKDISKLFPNFAKVTCHCSHESDQAHKPHRLLCWEPFALTTLTHFIPLISFYTPWKQNQRFSDVFRGCRKRAMAWNGLIAPWSSSRWRMV